MGKRWQRLLGGNPELARSISAYIKQRNKITRLEWTNIIRPMMRDVQNTIQQQILAIPPTEWEMFNLKRITDSINLTIRQFESQFANALVAGQEGLAQVASDFTVAQAPLVGLASPAQSLLGTELIETITPLTQNLVKYFADDMAKTIGGSISNSILTRKTVGQAVIDLRSKFGIDSGRIEKLQTEKVLLNNEFKKGNITKSAFQKRNKAINRQLNKGSIMSYARAERIVRTEMLTASSMAQQVTGLEIAEINPDARKVWLWSHKPTGRIDHQRVEAVTRDNPIRVDAPFIVGGESGMFPRSPELSAKQRISCACSQAIVNINDTAGLAGIGAGVRGL